MNWLAFSINELLEAYQWCSKRGNKQISGHFDFEAKIPSSSLTSNLSQATKNQMSSGLKLLNNVFPCLIVNGLLHVHFPFKAT